jgi:uncharacterized protein
MKKLLFAFLVLTCLVSAGQDLPKPPVPPRLVNDFAHVMTADQIADLENKLVAYDDTTSIQIAVVTISTTGDYDIGDYSQKLFREWKIGNKQTNNGLLILAAISDHKVYITTGYGMEGVVPDITAKQIIDNEIVPNFRANNYYRGFDLATDAVIKASHGEYKAPEGYNQRKNKGSGGSVFGVILFIIIIIVLASRGGGRGGGGVMGRSGVLPFIIGSMLGSSGRGGGWSGGGGGGWSGGGGGGFGGFGGGSSGGGGAGGSW